MPSPWPETPFRLITETGQKAWKQIPKDHYCRINAQTMALTHNSMFRGLNAVYNQALQVRPGSEDAANLLLYCTMVYDFIHNHHQMEENVYFPGIEKAAGKPGLMNINVEQHKELEKGLQKFRKYAEETTKETYDANKLRGIIDELGNPLGAHLRDEIPTILDLYDKVGSEELKAIYHDMEKEARKADMHKSSPFVFGTQDKDFLLDGKKHNFPNVPAVVPYIVDYIMTKRYSGAWRYSPSNIYGQPRPFTGLPSESSRPGLSLSMATGGLVAVAMISVAYMLRPWFAES